MQLPRRVFHLAEFSNWSSIERHGLMSASELMDAAEVSGARREQLEHGQRTEGVLLPSGVYLRDQRPLSPSALAACLHGMVTSEWYAALNARVFFWVNIDRLNRQRSACEPRPQVVLTIDVAGCQRLVETLRCRPSTPAMPGACQPGGVLPRSCLLRNGYNRAGLAKRPRSVPHLAQNHILQ